MAAEKTYWFAAYVFPGRDTKTIASLERTGIRYFVPTLHAGPEPRLRPLLVVSSLILIQSTQAEIFRLLRSGERNFAVFQDKYKKIQVLPDRQTERFIRLAGSEDAYFVFDPQQAPPCRPETNATEPAWPAEGEEKSASLRIGPLSVTVYVP